MNPGSDPEIPSLKPLGGKEEDKKGGASLPASSKPATPSGFKFPGFGGASTGGASKAFSAPNLKVRGLSGGGSTVMDRLKNLRKKDLIFIGAGLCTLGMAPLAEHLLMSPDEQSAKLQEGFNSQQGPLFQDGSSVYEPGNGVGSPGGLVGQGSDVITPLNVRDPSNLIMSPGASKKADAVVAPPPSAPAPSKGESDWKDVLRDSAKSGAGKAVSQSAKLPKPNVKMAGAIRGLSALGGGGGGTGASLKLDPLSASNVPNKAAGSGALTRSQATPGFRGATTRSNASSGAGEDLRAAGSRQSDIFNRGGGAAAALDAASREAIPTGGASGGGGGRPGEGGETKNPGGNSQKDNKSLGESLAFLRQKMEMEKSLDLKWEKKKWKEFGRQKMLEESAIKLGFDMFGKFAEKAVIGPLGDFIGQSITPGGSPGGIQCIRAGRATTYANGTGGRKYFCNAAGKGFSEDPKTGTVTDLGCDSCGAMAGGAASDSTGAKSDYQNPVTGIKGPPQEQIAEGAAKEIRDAYNRECKGDKPSYGKDNCTALDEIAKVGEVDFIAIQKHNGDAIRFLEQGYTQLTGAMTLLEKGNASLGATVGVAAGNGAAPADAPMSALKTKVDEAHAKLNAGKNTDAETALAAAKKDGLDKAVGPGGKAECASLKAGATLADACGVVQSTIDASDAAKGEFASAAAQVKAGYARAQVAEDAIKKQKGDSSTSGRAVEDAKTGLLGKLEALRKELAKTGGQAASEGKGGYVGSANTVQADKFENVRKSLLGDPADKSNARALAVSALAKGEELVNMPAAPWRKPGDFVPVPPATTPVANMPAGVTDKEQAAAQENMGKFSNPRSEFNGEVLAAQNQLKGTVQPLAQAKAAVDECSKNFACTPK